MFFGEILAVDVALGDSVGGVDGEGCVADLDGQTVLEIEKAHLTNVLQLTASLADLSLLESGVATGPPSENRERSRANLALLVVIGFRLRYTDIQRNFISKPQTFDFLGHLCILYKK